MSEAAARAMKDGQEAASKRTRPVEDGRADALLIVHGPPPGEELLRALDGGGVWSVLSFQDEEWDSWFASACDARGIAIATQRSARDDIDEASLAAREKYLDFMASWPNRPQRSGKNFKELFVINGDISAWWLSSASFKDNEANPIFDRLCDLELIRSAVSTAGVSRCVLATDVGELSGLVEQVCRQRSMVFSAVGGATRTKRVSLAHLVLGRLKLGVWLALTMLVSRALSARPRASTGNTLAAFFSIFPASLRLTEDGPRDPMYGTMLNRAATREGVEPIVLAAFATSGLLRWVRLLRGRRSLKRQSPRVHFVERYLRFGDLWFLLANVRDAYRYLRLERSPGFRASFTYDGLDAYELFADEFRKPFVGAEVARLAILAHTMSRAIDDLRPDVLACAYELYPIARAVYYGAAKSRHRPPTLTVQHANLNRLKMWYHYRPNELAPPTASRFIQAMPTPDRYLFQGTSAMRAAAEWGYPESAGRLTGSSRYDELAGAVQDHGPGRHKPHEPGRPRRVLVLPTLSATDSTELLHATARACSSGEDYTLLIRPHPDVTLHQEVAEARDRFPGVRIELVGGDLYGLIRGADVVVTSYSTSGDEAVVLGAPVICYGGVRPSLATFLDIPAAPIVRSVRELREVIARMISDQPYRERFAAAREQLIESSFYRLDGCAADRTIDELILTAGNRRHEPGS